MSRWQFFKFAMKELKGTNIIVLPTIFFTLALTVLVGSQLYLNKFVVDNDRSFNLHSI